MSDYIIQSGDNLSRIAKAHGTTVEELVKNNPQIKNPNTIFNGDTIKLPEAVVQNPENEDMGVIGLSIQRENKPEPKGEVAENTVQTQNEAQTTESVPSPLAKEDETDMTPLFYGLAGAGLYKAGEEALPYIKIGAQKGKEVIKEGAHKAGEYAGKAADKAKDLAQSGKEAVKEGAHKVGEYADKAADKAKNLAQSGKEAVKNGAKKAGEYAGKAADKAKNIAKAGGEAVKDGAKSVAKSGEAAAQAVGKGAKFVAPTMKAVGKIAKPVAAVIVTLDVAKAYKEGGTKAAVKQTGVAAASIGGAWAGAKAGAAVGAAIGSVVPGVGTAAGAVVGGILGSIGGWWAGEKVAKSVIG